MRNYRNVIAALALALVLLTPVLAGDGIMHTGIVSPTPTPSPTTTATGIMHTGATEAAQSTGDEPELTTTGIITETALDLLRSVLTLF